MGISAEAKWYVSDNCGNAYLKWRDMDSNEFLHEFYIYDPENSPIGTYVHEINECEINSLLHQLGYHNMEITLTKKMFNIIYTKKGHAGIGSITPISHIISPYGCCACVMPHAKYRLRW